MYFVNLPKLMPANPFNNKSMTAKNDDPTIGILKININMRNDKVVCMHKTAPSVAK